MPTRKTQTRVVSSGGRADRTVEPVYPPGADQVSRAQTIALYDMHYELVKLSLALVTHHELWGALAAAKASVEVCARIAVQSYDRYQRKVDDALR